MSGLDPKPSNLRLFAAVFPPRAALVELSAALAAHQSEPLTGMRFVPPLNLHLTLQFFGSIAPAQVEDLAHACASAADGGSCFELRLRSAGAFPQTRKARVVWLGVDAGAAELAQLSVALNAAASPLGLRAPEHDFTPHLTVARSSTPRDVSPLLAALAPIDLRMSIEALALVRSRMGGPTVRYETLARFELGSGRALT
jgi:2'-5' RNA ligase